MAIPFNSGGAVVLIPQVQFLDMDVGTTVGVQRQTLFFIQRKGIEWRWAPVSQVSRQFPGEISP